MTRFILGFAAGALLIAALQFLYAPLPTRSQDNVATVASPPEDNLEAASATRAVAQRPPERRPANRPSGGSSGAGGVSASETDAPEVENDADVVRHPIDLPSTHAGFVDNARPSLPDEHASLEREDVDGAWAQLVEELILTFLSEHPRGADISIVSLACRTTRCEIAGTVYGEKGGDVWQTVLSDMRRQPWFASHFADSASGAGGSMPGEHRFISMLARVGSKIAPPVDP